MNKVYMKIVEKALKWPLQYANFQNFFGGACSRTPLESFLLLKLLKTNLAGKNYAGKSDKIWCPFPEKYFENAPYINHFQRAYLRPFPGRYVFVFR